MPCRRSIDRCLPSFRSKPALDFSELDFRDSARLSRSTDLAADQARFARARLESDLFCGNTLRWCVGDYSIAGFDRGHRLSVPAIDRSCRRVFGPGLWSMA